MKFKITQQGNEYYNYIKRQDVKSTKILKSGLGTCFG